MERKVKLPTLDQLNKVSCSKIALLQCRLLCTSDLTFQYMLYSTKTIEDILRVTKDALNAETNENTTDLTHAEKTELLGYLRDLEESCK